MSRASRPRARTPDPAEPQLALGFLATLPLFLAYELGLAFAPGAPSRASAEAALARGLAPLGERLQGVRIALLLAVTVWAFLVARRRREGELGRLLGSEAGLGVLAGFLLGPLLAWLQVWLGSPPLTPEPEPARGLFAALRLVGAAPWEELLFRVALYGSLFLLARRTCAFLGFAAPLARASAELAALLASAVLFALFHLASVQALLGTQGEPFHRGLFLWRVSAGLLLGGLFRWRGLGAAAWAHAVFNLGIALGLGP